MSLSKSKCLYSNNCLHFLKHVVPLSNYMNSKNSKICLTQSLQIITVMLQEGGWLLKPFFLVRSIDIQPFADACSSYITRLPIVIMPMDESAVI